MSNQKVTTKKFDTEDLAIEALSNTRVGGRPDEYAAAEVAYINREWVLTIYHNETPAPKVVGYGIKKDSNVEGGLPKLFTTGDEWISARFVGLGARHAAKEWKTEAGAKKAAARFGGTVFTFTDDQQMNY